ncbi:unnamed protein product [Meganyctiphanes norvegica]|uniref:Uncharacterized protein n=1 Tax=Meganyctiphanes norvegica TaxID=48144 RepID=A0AAV2Q5K1_MEGNR
MAIMYASTVIDIDKSNIEAYTLRGNCQEELGTIDSLEKAIEDFTIVCNRMKTEESSAILINIKNVLQENLQECIELAINSGKHQEALSNLNRALKIETGDENTTASLYFTRASVHFKEECFKEAIKDLKSCLEINQEDVAAYRLRAKCYHKIGNYLDAIKDLGVAFEQNSSQLKEDSAALYLRAQCYHKLGNYEDAIKDLGVICEENQSLNKEDSTAYYLRAQCYQKLDNYEDAIKDLGIVCEQNPTEHNETIHQRLKQKLQQRIHNDVTNALKMENYNQAYDMCSKALNIKTKNKHLIAQLYCDQATAAYELKSYKEAFKDANLTLQNDQDNKKALIVRAKCYEQREMYEEAVSDYAILYENNSSTENKDNLENSKLILKQKMVKDGNNAFKTGNLEKAISHYTKALEIQTTNKRINIGIYYNRALMFFRKKKIGRAKLDLTNCIELDPQHIMAYNLKARCYEAQEKFSKAQDVYCKINDLQPCEENTRNIKKLYPKIQEKKYIEGQSALLKKEYNEAFSILSEAILIESENRNIMSKIYFHRAYALYRLKKYNESVEDCSSALEFDSSLINLYKLRAKCYHELEKYEEAVNDFEKLFSMDKTQENEKMLSDAKKMLPKEMLNSAMRRQPKDQA